MVAARAHQKGSRTSATNPSSMKMIQNIFFCIGRIVAFWLSWGATAATIVELRSTGQPRRLSLHGLILLAFGGL